MRKCLYRIGLTTFLWFSPLFATAFGQGADANTKKWLEYKKEATERWEKLFGKKINLSNKHIWNYLYQVNPQPLSKFQPLGDRKLSEIISTQIENCYFMFLNKKIRPKSKAQRIPELLFVAKRETFDTSLMVKRWQKGHYRLLMYLSGNSVLWRVAPQGYKPGTAVTDKELAKIIYEVLTLSEPHAGPDADGRPSAKYGSEAAVIKGFGLPAKIDVGQIFTNIPKQFFGFPPVGWQDNVWGFVSDTDICLICFKSSGARMFADFPLNRFWLNEFVGEQKKGMLERQPALCRLCSSAAKRPQSSCE